MIPPGYELLVRRISFSTLVGLALRVGFASGVFFGVGNLLLMVISGEDRRRVLGFTIGSTGEAVASCIWMPAYLACAASMIAATAYLPLRWWMACTGGIPMDLVLYRRSDFHASKMPGGASGGSAGSTAG